MLAHVGQQLATSEAEISSRTGLPAGYVRSAVAGLAADGDRYAHGTVPPHSFQCVVSAVGLRLVEPNRPLG